MLNRLIYSQIKEDFFKGKVLIIVGPRQTGKTTLCTELQKNYEEKYSIKHFDAEDPEVRDDLNNKGLGFLKKLIGDANIVIIDEGQKVSSIGQTLKLLVDHYKKEKQIIVTGSSSLNLLDRTQEPLTGRKFVYNLYPLSLEEIYPNKNWGEIQKELKYNIIYGFYPEVIAESSFKEKERKLKEITSSYLYRDVLQFDFIKKSNIITKLLKALALQVGSEVSYGEISRLIGISKPTVANYIDILEKSFVLFRLVPYCRNKRRELCKLNKIYFYDIGIRNALINNFNHLDSRNDVGALWENFMIVERLKYREYHRIYMDQYFWKTYDGSEIDLIEEYGSNLDGYEFKWGKNYKRKKPSSLWTAYKESTYKIITPDNIDGFII